MTGVQTCALPISNQVKNLRKTYPKQDKNYITYNNNVNKKYISIPNLKGMSGMDAVALLGNLNIKVKAIGIGKVKKQSIQAGQPIVKNQVIILELS